MGEVFWPLHWILLKGNYQTLVMKQIMRTDKYFKLFLMGFIIHISFYDFH